jgi:hypothetical protein
MWTWEASELEILYRYVLPFFIVRTRPCRHWTQLAEVVFRCSINYWTVFGWWYSACLPFLCDWWPTKPFKLYAWRPGLIYAQVRSCFRTPAHSPRISSLPLGIENQPGRNFYGPSTGDTMYCRYRWVPIIVQLQFWRAPYLFR